ISRGRGLSDPVTAEWVSVFGEKSQWRMTSRSEDEDSSGWRGFLSSMGLSIPATLCRLAPPALRLNQRRMLQGKAPDIPEHVLRLAGVGPDKLRAEWTFPAFIAMFLPEFPHKAVPGHEHLQVIPKAEILRLGVLEQSKEEVIIQVGIRNRPLKIMTQNVL
ncbi:unnamed protein product, partial [Tetraodon nigroviridis]